MATAYSLEVREEVFKLHEQGVSQKNIAETLGTSLGFVFTLLHRFKNFEDCRLYEERKAAIDNRNWDCSMRYHSNYSGATYVDPLTRKIDYLFEKGYTPHEIALLTQTSEEYLNILKAKRDGEFEDTIIGRLGPAAADPEFAGCTVVKLENFRDNKCNIGDKFKIFRTINLKNQAGTRKVFLTCTVLEKYPFIVRTDIGDFQYTDLYFGQRVKE